MTKSMLSDEIIIRGRFQRSVQLIKDWQDKRSIGDFLLTPTTKQIAEQIANGALSDSGARAWSITGPYGSGKSAFALFLTDLFANRSPKHIKAQRLRKENGIEDKVFIPVLNIAERNALVPRLLLSLSESLENKIPKLKEKVSKAAKKSLSKELSDREAVDLIEEVANDFEKDKNYDGLLIIIDEFGKYLEYASQHPSSEDLLFMQDLAEVAERSKTPIILITILHSAFAEYLSVLDEARRAEWRKVQGRFTDVAFLEPPEQFLRLISAAIKWNNENNLYKEYTDKVNNTISSSVFDEAQKRFPLASLLPGCAPLHPITALLLWPLFRSKLAQNERSLFAFLTDYGPYGFQEFLSLAPSNSEAPQFYRIDKLYDYVVTTLGPSIYLGNRSKRWAGIEHACDRVGGDAPELSKAVVKAVGMINLYGRPVGLKASKGMLEKCFGETEKTQKAIEHLEKASIIVYRRYDETFALWEGSDVNIEEAYDKAARHIGHGKRAGRLKQFVELRPIVAKAHYIKKGTMRYFLVDVIEASRGALKEAYEKKVHPADGSVVFVLTKDPHEREQLIDIAKKLTANSKPANQLRIFGFPKEMVGLEKALREIEGWMWILENVQALEGDPVARQEVRTRVNHARSQLMEIAGSVLGLRGYLFEPSSSGWIQGGQEHKLNNTLNFQQWLSSLCDEVYHKAPEFHNELLNREDISSAATAGRRQLIEAMIQKESEKQLGITGTPSEYSMYRSLLETGGFHQEYNGVWIFEEPNKKWRPVWRAITDFLVETETNRLPLLKLIEKLKNPPIGLREGPIPVLLTAYLLVERDKVALYEKGLFVPKLRIEVLERLTRVPDRFEIQKYKLDKSTRKAFDAVSDVLQSLNLTTRNINNPDLLKIVKPLVIFVAELPSFTEKTKRIDPPVAMKVRDICLQARDPHKLIFEDLPSVLGVSINNDEDEIKKFASRLKDSLIGLKQAYPRLLDDIEEHFREMFALDGTSIEVKQRLQDRSEPLVGYAGDRTLDLFVRQASNLGERDWREALAPVINKGVPPEKWSDHDFVDFQVKLRRVASDFVRLEELVAERKKSKASRILRVGILDGKVDEAREVISIPPNSEEEVNKLAAQIRGLLKEEDTKNNNNHRVELAALTKVVQGYLRSEEE